MPRKRALPNNVDALRPVEPAAAPVANAVDASLKVQERLINKAFEAGGLAIDTVTRQAQKRELEILTAALMEEKRELGKQDFWYFLTEVLFPETWNRYYSEEFHGPIAHRLQYLERGANIGFILPREHRKSFVTTLAYSLWKIIRDPDIRIMLIGARLQTIKKWSILIRSAFMPGAQGFGLFQKLYPDYMFGTDKKRSLEMLEWTVPTRKKAVADATFFATYLGVAGAGARADIQIFDDPYERRNVATPEMSLKSLQQTLDLFPLIEVAEQSEYCNRIFLATRWAYHDPTGAFLGERHEETVEASDEMEGAPLFDFMVRHAFEDPNRLCEECPKHIVQAHPHGHPDVEHGEPILHPIVTRAALMKRLEEYKKDPNRGESLWYHQYQNVCKSPSSQKIKNEWIITAQFPAFPAPRKRIIACDSADKDMQSPGIGDYMVALFGEYDDYGRLVLVNGLRSNKWTRQEFHQRIIVWCQATGWWPHQIVKENFGEGAGAWLADLGRAFQDRYQTPHLVGIRRPGTALATGGYAYMRKLDWIISNLQAPMERGEVVFGRDFPVDLRERAKYELTNLGQVKNDDVADTLALFMVEGIRVVRVVSHGLPAPGPQPPPLALYEGAGNPPKLQIGIPIAQQPLTRTRSVQITLEEIQSENKIRELIPKLDISY